MVKRGDLHERRLIITSTISSVLGLIAIIVAIGVGIAHEGDVTTSRENAALDTCRLFRGLAIAATSNSSAARRNAIRYIRRTPLHNCQAYAVSLVRGAK